MRDQSPFRRKSTPLVISRAFAVVLSRMRVRVTCPVLQPGALLEVCKFET
jgi:hypothetical protein